MCLYVNFNKTIDDNKVYTFYKVYNRERINKTYPLGLSCIYMPSTPKSVDLVAKANNGKPLPAYGQDAYDKYADESGWNYDPDGNPETKINEGIHAYTSKKAAKARFYKDFEVMVKVEVKGEHIIAFGSTDEVAFTRGKIIGEV